MHHSPFSKTPKAFEVIEHRSGTLHDHWFEFPGECACERILKILKIGQYLIKL